MPPRTSRRIVLTLLGVTTASWSSAGRAATPKPTTWWIETHPWTCSAEAAPLARQVQLACEATGRCAIAGDERSADRHAVLVCAEEGWTLEARDANDQPLWTLALGATDDEARFRKAGVWIARSEGDDPLELPPSPTAATTAATATTATATTAMAATTRPSVLAAPAEAREPDAVPDDSKAARLAFATLVHGSTPRADRDAYGAAWGGRALLVGSAPRATGPLLFGIAGTAEHSSERTDYTLVLAGLTLGLDASVGDFRLGVLVEGGAGHLELPLAPAVGSGPFGPQYIASRSGFGEWLPYAQASLFAQWSPPGPFHPYVSPTVTWLIDRGSHFPTPIPNGMLGLDVGLVWGQM